MRTPTIYRSLSLILITVSILFSSCGVYRKPPAVIPQGQQWEGPLLNHTEPAEIQILIHPEVETIRLHFSEGDEYLLAITK
jgi:hypothetical protein